MLESKVRVQSELQVFIEKLNSKYIMLQISKKEY